MLTISDKVVVKTFSGLGNQLFQLASGLQQTNRLSVTLLCDRSENGGVSEREYALSRLEGLCGFESTSNINEATDLDSLKEFREETEFKFDPSINNISLGTRISGYFQHPHYSTESISVLLQALTGLHSVKPEQNSIHIHVRRGDININPYLRKKLGVLDIQYYVEALKFLGLENINSQKLKIFSDSPYEVLALFKTVFYNKEVVLGKLHADPLSNLLELSNTSTLIGANSTFSWWAARIMESVNPEVRIVFPEGMLRNIPNSRVLVQPNWSTIKPTWK